MTETSKTTDEQDTSIQHIADAYKTAVWEKDVDAFVALFDQDVYVFDMWEQWDFEGLTSWRAMATDWFGSLGDERVAVKMENIETRVIGDAAFLHAFVTFAGTSAAGETLRAMQNRLTWVLVRKDGQWKIVHEHTSAPASFETGKVILQRG